MDWGLWRKPDDIIWALQEASKPGGFCPNARCTVTLLEHLEAEGFLYESPRCPVWEITPKGREELARLEVGATAT